MKLDFDSLLMLAPLAGYTDMPFRSVVKQFGVDITVSEMISSNALINNSAKTLKMIQKSSSEIPYSVQLAGNSEVVLQQAVEFLNTQDGIDIIDLNCGCPATKVANHGSGSSLLKDLKKLESMLKVIKRHSNKQYLSAKIRLGFNEKNPVEIAKVVENAGADFLVVHGRTKKDAYKKECIDYDSIALVKQNVNIPVIANGDIDSYDKAKFVLEHTKANGLMIGRAAVAEPWIFYQIKHDEESISKELKARVVLEHFDKIVDFYGDYGAILFRKQAHAYSKGIENASEFRNKINQEYDTQRMRLVLCEFFI